MAPLHGSDISRCAILVKFTFNVQGWNHSSKSSVTPTKQANIKAAAATPWRPWIIMYHLSTILRLACRYTRNTRGLWFIIPLVYIAKGTACHLAALSTGRPVVSTTSGSFTLAIVLVLKMLFPRFVSSDDSNSRIILLVKVQCRYVTL